MQPGCTPVYGTIFNVHTGKGCLKWCCLAYTCIWIVINIYKADLFCSCFELHILCFHYYHIHNTHSISVLFTNSLFSIQKIRSCPFLNCMYCWPWSKRSGFLQTRDSIFTVMFVHFKLCIQSCVWRYWNRFKKYLFLLSNTYTTTIAPVQTVSIVDDRPLQCTASSWIIPS